MRKSVLILACLIGCTLSAFAQDQKFEGYFGYGFVSAGKNGWNGDVGYKFAPRVTGLADFGGYYSHNNDIHSYMFGVKVDARHRSGFTPFGRFILGGSHVGSRSGASDSAFSWAVGGGVESSIRDNWGLRLSADAYHTHFFDNGDFHVRLGAGIVYRF